MYDYRKYHERTYHHLSDDNCAAGGLAPPKVEHRRHRWVGFSSMRSTQRRFSSLLDTFENECATVMV